MKKIKGWLATKDLDGPSLLKLRTVAAAASVPLSVTSKKVWWMMLSNAAPLLLVIRLKTAQVGENRSVTPRSFNAFCGYPNKRIKF